MDKSECILNLVDLFVDSVNETNEVADRQFLIEHHLIDNIDDWVEQCGAKPVWTRLLRLDRDDDITLLYRCLRTAKPRTADIDES